MSPEQNADTDRAWSTVSIWDKRGGAFVHARYPYSNDQLLKALHGWAIDERQRYANEPARSSDKVVYGYRTGLLEAVEDLLGVLLNDGSECAPNTEERS